MSKNQQEQGAMVAGFLVIGLIVVGVGSIIGSALALFNGSDSGPDYVGAGIFALAGAVAFGQLLSGLVRS